MKLQWQPGLARVVSLVVVWETSSTKPASVTALLNASSCLEVLSFSSRAIAITVCKSLGSEGYSLKSNYF